MSEHASSQGVNLTITRNPNKPENVVILVNGRYVCEFDWKTADDVAALIKATARHAEEYAKANQIIAHQALLTRTGAPFGLSNHPKIQEEAYKEAQWGDARKRMPIIGVPSPKTCGTPSLVKHKRIGG
jgi:hypothetical protein